ncbi:MAG: hypothetical protein ACLVJ1_10590 [Oscillospiraceae bacterium]
MWRIWLNIFYIALYTAPGEQPGLCLPLWQHEPCGKNPQKLSGTGTGANREEKHGRPRDAEKTAPGASRIGGEPKPKVLALNQKQTRGPKYETDKQFAHYEKMYHHPIVFLPTPHGLLPMKCTPNSTNNSSAPATK